MGLDAVVYCTCFREGVTEPPPETIRTYIVTDEEGYPDLDFPMEDERFDEYLAMFDEWLGSCCPHPNLWYADERITDWEGYTRFLQVLEQAGWQRFPALYEALPSGNEGRTDAALARRALEELHDVREGTDLGTGVHLLDGETGEMLYLHTSDAVSFLGWNVQDRTAIGLDEEGFFVGKLAERDLKVEEILFRSIHFEQIRKSNGRAVLFQDLRSGTRILSNLSIQDGERLPRLLQVEKRQISGKDFDYILQPLINVFQASVETGNPVIWG
ncbi:hypothetical protein JIR001_28100 [Polycladomyces abyssicola]|uniref:Uncharacterized protein n=1 Tax=Polycladomyces abyssicola TaxID=1125966 RepID=A0A8D5ZPG6_9BACL|nr:hypothetical protein [Polycladomyces abyssicola]BCU83027.1 hypothetical protein JIR001_28100 [Polycladomyces abyssicola]